MTQILQRHVELITDALAAEAKRCGRDLAISKQAGFEPVAKAYEAEIHALAETARLIVALSGDA